MPENHQNDVPTSSNLTCCHVRGASDPFDISKPLPRLGLPENSQEQNGPLESNSYHESPSPVEFKDGTQPVGRSVVIDKSSDRCQKEKEAREVDNGSNIVSAASNKKIKKHSLRKSSALRKSSKDHRKDGVPVILDDTERPVECATIPQPGCVKTSSSGPTALYFDEDQMLTRDSAPSVFPDQRSPKGIYSQSCSYYPPERRPVSPIPSHLNYNPPSSCTYGCNQHAHGVNSIPTSATKEGGEEGRKFFLTETAVDIIGCPRENAHNSYGRPPLMYVTPRLNSEERIIDQTPEIPPRPWDYENRGSDSLRSSCAESYTSTDTIYANTSDPGAPEPRYMNIFESSSREDSLERSQFCCQEEPIYATVGDRLIDERELLSAGYQYGVYSRDMNTGHRCRARLEEPNGSNQGTANNSEKVSLSSSTQTLCPEDEAITEEKREGKTRSSIPSSSKSQGGTMPPKLPPKTCVGKHFSSELPSKAMSEPPQEKYGLRIRLPLMNPDGSSSDCHSFPRKYRPDPPPRGCSVPVYSGARDGLDKVGPLYVVIGSTSGKVNLIILDLICMSY